MTQTTQHDNVRALQWTESGLEVLDQRKLPEVVEYETFTSCAGVTEAIDSMRVRGAPAIGVAAAFGVVLAVQQRYAENPADWQSRVEADLENLADSRPTAVNLFWAITEMRAAFSEAGANPVNYLLEKAKQIHADDIAANRTMGQLGAELVADDKGILTHCNTGSLATGGYGTALGVIRSAVAQGEKYIYATETRPWLQGARLTLWELMQDKIPATLIADSAAAYLMSLQAIQWVILGADRIASNGDVANKIGTYALAVAAKHHGVRFMVVAPTTTIDWDIDSGEQIIIENREESELLRNCYDQAESVVDAWNPVFDVTPAALIDAIVTERGVVLNPTRESMKQVQK